ncbi:tRNA pseudouridine(55) synthase TruB [Aliarcobacter butzleri]|uniref:tRNA pseudouridine(55) synthase TruB n=1 Tax=Aliarcobacter butzleri TaxID=28197 RepID=UPI0021B23AAF|nr:tRNA pseudouridine(55) synthase TruB [Aliarcobacter butzleri]MCT7565500.1 tRNA pseudouridine(55) synthase TruB [Aliarcobacter butzleri]MCT7569483.1 tRNA pseudouridine(55) synthase TruB [Aliarcobacter butzleri]MCT7571639.1 tRNA pseudouridine(55) synthase TruB [Aliarcobacter butzleri]MCT7574122.1 tRNA pseudouridine(55) synthase TruB [Aliarcobacter butzleri]MCT7580083.1 tRNA pseudouridine(55) synthase TruB [Aliarcobacter butzleri]
MQVRFYEKEQLNKLLVVNKPIFMSSNFYLNRIKRKYKNKKAGFSGTLDPFAKGCLIVAFGQYAKLFKYLSKTPKTYKAVIWLGVKSKSLDIEEIESIGLIDKLDKSHIIKELNLLKGEIEYIPPKFSAKKIDGKRAYELARNGVEVELNKTKMTIFDTKFVLYNHPFITFEVTVSEGTYVRSFAQILLEKLNSFGTLSYLERLNEGEFFYENEKELNPLDFIKLPVNKYLGTTEWLEKGKKIGIEYVEKKDNGKYLILTEKFFSIIEIVDNDVKYLINKVPKYGI